MKKLFLVLATTVALTTGLAQAQTVSFLPENGTEVVEGDHPGIFIGGTLTLGDTTSLALGFWGVVEAIDETSAMVYLPWAGEVYQVAAVTATRRNLSLSWVHIPDWDNRIEIAVRFQF